MLNIPLPPLNAEQAFDDITEAKRPPQKNHLQTARTAVFTAYQYYEDAVPEVAALPVIALTEPQRRALVHAYEVKTAPMAKLRSAIFERVAVARCPLCGLSESSTLDHYLPKELNPQFSIFPMNLFPCCFSCNTKKREQILDDEADNRLFLHPYFDIIPQIRFMRLNIAILPNAITLKFKIFRPAGITLRQFRQLESHFEKLGLAIRYRMMALEHLRGRYASIARIYGAGHDAALVAARLNEEATDLEASYGVNYWETVLYRELANNEAFCNGGFEVLNAIQ